MSDEKKERFLLPEGRRKAIAQYETVQIGWANNRTSEQISVLFELVGEPAGRITYWGSFANQQAIEITLKNLRTAGWDGISPIGVGTGELVGLGGKVVELVIEHHTYEGKTNARVAYVNAIGVTAKDPLDGGALAKLNARVKQHMGATAPIATRGAALTQPTTPEPPEEDIPF